MSIPHEVSDPTFVTEWNAVTFVKSSRRIVEASTLTIAVAQVLRTHSTLVGVLEFILLLLTTSTFQVLRLLGIQALLAEGNLFWRKSFVGE